MKKVSNQIVRKAVSFLSGTMRSNAFQGSRFSELYIIVLLLFVSAGCGKKGPPLPPVTIVPEAVKSFNVEGREEGLLITWSLPKKNSDGSPVTDIAGFKLYRKSKECEKCPSDFPLYLDIDIDSPQGVAVERESLYLVDREVKAGVEYLYKIAAYNRSGYFGEFSDVKTAHWSQSPPPPQGLEAEPGDRSVRLIWTSYEPEGFAGYRVYRRDSSGDYSRQPLTKRPAMENVYTDIGLENNRQYYYVVKAVVDRGKTLIEGPPSREVLAIPLDMIPPSAPQGLRLAPSYGVVNLSWEAGTEKDIAGYIIYRRKESELAMERLAETTSAESHYSDNGVSSGERYFYSITAFDGSPQRNESDSSAEVSVLVPEKL